jgi:type IV pilus assembly protein PilW
VKQRQLGVSLVEILVSITIGLFMIAAVLSLYQNSRQTFRVQEAFARVQENARFALEVSDREIRKAGYRTAITPSFATAFPTVTGLPAGRVIGGTSQLLRLRYQGSGTPADGSITDCRGNALAAGETAVIVLRLNGTDLTCDRITAGGTVSQPLVSGIEAIGFAYGWDTTGDGYADSYHDNGDSTAPTVSIRFTFTLASDDTRVAQAGDGRLRRNYTQVTALRNVIR